MGYVVVTLKVQHQIQVTSEFHEYFLWNCSQVNATEHVDNKSTLLSKPGSGVIWATCSRTLRTSHWVPEWLYSLHLSRFVTGLLVCWGVSSWVPMHNLNQINTLQWRHNESDGVLNHRRLDCLLNRFFQAQIKENIKVRRLRLLRGEFTAEFTEFGRCVTLHDST